MPVTSVAMLASQAQARPSPAEVVMTSPDLTGPAAGRELAALQGRAAASGPVRGPVIVAPLAAPSPELPAPKEIVTCPQHHPSAGQVPMVVA